MEFHSSFAVEMNTPAIPGRTAVRGGVLLARMGRAGN